MNNDARFIILSHNPRTMSGKPCCDVIGCDESGLIVSRLSPEGYLVATGKKAYSFREAYRQFRYCKKCHDYLMSRVWNRVNSSDDKTGDHVAPTAI
ncbi:MAG: hypothetical protein CMB56_002315 [Methanobacteriota archaeon]|nr:MAG: hypothetical protein CMB56_002315 [Euryarchaeota archaeon]|tara:strand:- start:15392 stop:15679 length:288 start_codon:yes stop_codon:yes gene_type:complete